MNIYFEKIKQRKAGGNMLVKATRKRVTIEELSVFLGLITLGLKQQARQIIEQAFERGDITESAFLELLPEGQTADKKVISRLKECLKLIGITIRHNGQPEQAGALMSDSSSQGEAVLIGHLMPNKAKSTKSIKARQTKPAGVGQVTDKISVNEREFRSRQDYLLQLYMRQVKTTDLLSREETTELAKRVLENNDFSARDKLISCYLLFVVKIAYGHGYRGRMAGLNLLDLIQEGNVGLMRAIEKYDYRLGYALTTYASWWIRQTIERAIENEPSPIRVPVHHWARWSRAQSATKLFKQKFGREPDVDELAAIIGVTAKNIGDSQYALQFMRSVLRLDQPMIESDAHHADAAATDNFHRMVPDESCLNPAKLFLARQELRQACERLQMLVYMVRMIFSRRDAEVFSSYYGLDGLLELKTLREVGAHQDLSHERIRQILHDKIWSKLPKFGFKKDENWLFAEIKRIRLLENLVGEIAKI